MTSQRTETIIHRQVPRLQLEELLGYIKQYSYDKLSHIYYCKEYLNFNAQQVYCLNKDSQLKSYALHPQQLIIIS
jgi:hypothetical protein